MRGVPGRVVSQCFVASKAGVGAPPRRLNQYCAKCEHVLQLVEIGCWSMTGIMLVIGLPAYQLLPMLVAGQKPGSTKKLTDSALPCAALA